MNENQPTAPHTQPMPTPQEQPVGFPSPQVRGEKKSGGILKWVVAGIGVIVIIAVGAIFVLRQPTDSDDANLANSNSNQGSVLQAVATPAPTQEATPSPTPTPEPIEKSEVSIQILNGTGTPGDASLVKSALEDIDFVDITAENADDQEETETTLTYTSSMTQQIVDEIEAALEEIFGNVRVRKGTVSEDYDIRILTGPKGESDTSDTSSDTSAEE